jgi:hypothetical protein
MEGAAESAGLGDESFSGKRRFPQRAETYLIFDCIMTAGCEIRIAWMTLR